MTFLATYRTRMETTRMIARMQMLKAVILVLHSYYKATCQDVTQDRK